MGAPLAGERKFVCVTLCFAAFAGVVLVLAPMPAAAQILDPPLRGVEPRRPVQLRPTLPDDPPLLESDRRRWPFRHGDAYTGRRGGGAGRRHRCGGAGGDRRRRRGRRGRAGARRRDARAPRGRAARRRSRTGDRDEGPAGRHHRSHRVGCHSGKRRRHHRGRHALAGGPPGIRRRAGGIRSAAARRRRNQSRVRRRLLR